jgi:hypothetical protein
MPWVCSIIQRAGVVPLSIAGIFKEVTTISISAWVFGDQLTKLNIIGVGVTFIGICTYTFHKYQKSINSPRTPDTRGYSAPSDRNTHMQDIERVEVLHGQEGYLRPVGRESMEERISSAGSSPDRDRRKGKRRSEDVGIRLSGDMRRSERVRYSQDTGERWGGTVNREFDTPLPAVKRTAWQDWWDKSM